MVRIFLYVVLLLNVLQLPFCVHTFATTKLDELTLIAQLSACIAGLLCLLALYVHHKYLSNRSVVISTPPNGDTPSSLGTFFGIGFILVGRWRNYHETYVGYTFLTIGLPVLPTGCYRYRVVGTEGTKITYQIYGSEKFSFKEIFCMYVYMYAVAIWIVAVLMYFYFCHFR